MKNIILLSQSLTGDSFKMLKSQIGTWSSDVCVYVFHDIETTAEIGGVKNNYDTVFNLVRNKGIPIKMLDEYNLDEYFSNHHDGDIYITPTESTPVIVSSASLLKYNGNIYLFASSENEPEVTNLAPFIRAFKYKDAMGVKGLNKEEVSHNHSKGSKCHYTINGTTYSQILKSKGEVKDSGLEGYTMLCDELPEYRIKIWDSFSLKYQYEIDEVALMIKNEVMHPSIALPMAFVYNEANEPIGFVMKNFKGRELDIRSLKDKNNPFKIVEQMLKAMLWMEVNNLFHRDANHNMLIDKDENLAVIDVDSIQYKAFPARASASDPLNALPRKYSSNSLFYNTIDISYTTMAFIVAAVFDIEIFFGTWDEDGMCPLDQVLLDKLRTYYPSIARIVTEAYVDGKPVAISRQLKAVQDVLSGNDKVSDDDYYYTEGENYGDYSSEIEEASYDDEFNGDIPVGRHNPYDNEYSDAHKSEDNSYSSHSSNNGTEGESAQKKVTAFDGNEPNESLYKLVWFFKKLILSMFSTGTVVSGMTPEGEWKEFIRSRKWVKPLVTTSLAVVLIIVMVIAIILM